MVLAGWNSVILHGKEAGEVKLGLEGSGIIIPAWSAAVRVGVEEQVGALFMHPVGHAQALKTLQVCLRLTTTGPLLHHHLSSETIVLNPTVSYSNLQLYILTFVSWKFVLSICTARVWIGLQIRNSISRRATSGGGGSHSIDSSCVGGRLFYPILFC